MVAIFESVMPPDTGLEGVAARLRSQRQRYHHSCDRPVCRDQEHVCGCTAPGCRCKVMTLAAVCSLVGEYERALADTSGASVRVREHVLHWLSCLCLFFQYLYSC